MLEQIMQSGNYQKLNQIAFEYKCRNYNGAVERFRNLNNEERKKFYKFVKDTMEKDDAIDLMTMIINLSGGKY